jgi:hypothetical protein
MIRIQPQHICQGNAGDDQVIVQREQAFQGVKILYSNDPGERI